MTLGFNPLQHCYTYFLESKTASTEGWRLLSRNKTTWLADHTDVTVNPNEIFHIQWHYCGPALYTVKALKGRSSEPCFAKNEMWLDKISILPLLSAPMLLNVTWEGSDRGDKHRHVQVICSECDKDVSLFKPPIISEAYYLKIHWKTSKNLTSNSFPRLLNIPFLSNRERPHQFELA